MQVRNDEICPLCQEEEETTLHLLGKCCALINQQLEILGSHYLEYEDLALLHWRSLLRLAKASKRF